MASTPILACCRSSWWRSPATLRREAMASRSPLNHSTSPISRTVCGFTACRVSPETRSMATRKSPGSPRRPACWIVLPARLPLSTTIGAMNSRASSFTGSTSWKLAFTASAKRSKLSGTSRRTRSLASSTILPSFPGTREPPRSTATTEALILPRNPTCLMLFPTSSDDGLTTALSRCDLESLVGERGGEVAWSDRRGARAISEVRVGRASEELGCASVSELSEWDSEREFKASASAPRMLPGAETRLRLRCGCRGLSSWA
mmetsp:Transcript_17309/g.41349  ORF Transcript_17309/g.41349 Transcript_17309/m.41349 type:complete len:261 (-) Transcript_17309:1296-2078(-)